MLGSDKKKHLLNCYYTAWLTSVWLLIISSLRENTFTGVFKKTSNIKRNSEKRKKTPKALVIILTVLNTAVSEVTVNYLTLLWSIWH